MKPNTRIRSGVSRLASLLVIAVAACVSLGCDVAVASQVIAVAAGNRLSLQLRDDGSVWAWGSGYAGELGDGRTSGFSSLPRRVFGLPASTAIAAGDGWGLALDRAGNVWTWGTAHLDGSVPVATRPHRIPNLDDVAEIVATFLGMPKFGHGYAIARKRDGSVWTWGNRGDTNNPSPDDAADPELAVRVPGIADARGIAAGLGFGYAILANGRLVAWGRGAIGSAPQGSTAPFVVPGIDAVRSVATFQRTYAIKSDGTLWTWDASSQAPTQVPGITDASHVAYGFQGGWLLTSSGTVRQITPQEILPATALTRPVRAVAAGLDHSLLLDSDGRVFALGSNSYGQLGWATR